MEEFEEAEILWPAAGSDDDDVADDDDGSVAAPMPACSARPKTAAPIEISRRKRRCRPWTASECYTATFDEETDAVVADDEEDEEEGHRTGDAKGAARDDGLVIVPPHVLVARRRLRLVGGRTAAYSMCAGKGRTLKGRDLRNVRNQVLRMTGFIEG